MSTRQKTLQILMIASVLALVLQACGEMSSNHRSSTVPSPSLMTSQLESAGFPGAVLTNSGLTDLARTVSEIDGLGNAASADSSVGEICNPGLSCVEGGTISVIHDGDVCTINYDECDTGEEIVDGDLIIGPRTDGSSGHCFDFSFNMWQTMMHSGMMDDTYCIDEEYLMHETQEGGFYIYHMGQNNIMIVDGYDADMQDCTVAMILDADNNHWELAGLNHCDISSPEGDW